MATAILTRDTSAGLEADIVKFDRMLEAYLAGRLEEDEFRLFRLSNGIYGQRQPGCAGPGGQRSCRRPRRSGPLALSTRAAGLLH